MQIDIITIFPKLFENFLKESLLARAQKNKIISIKAHDLRDWTADKHKTVDDKPYGGGAGMVLMAEPVIKAVDDLKKNALRKSTKNAKSGNKVRDAKSRVVTMSAKGKIFNQAIARRWSKLDHLIIISGRYEGIDERINKYIADEEISIGNFVTFGGDVPAMLIIEAVTRLIPGVVGKQESVKDESFSAPLSRCSKPLQLEYPHYTRPEVLEINGKRRRVPKVLLSGDHKKIEKWREKHKGLRWQK